METRVKRMLEEALGKDEKHDRERGDDFWAGKTACWQMCHCPPAIRDECPATKYTFLPCWEIEGTYCKLQMKGSVVTGTDTNICEVCRVHKKYGDNKPIELKLFGKGLNVAVGSPDRISKRG